MQSSKTRLKLFEYFKTKICPKSILFLQERHSSIEFAKEWSDEFNSSMYYSNRKKNVWGVLIIFLGDVTYTVTTQVNDSNGRFLILGKEIDRTKYRAVNLYNANTESGQIKSLKTLSDMLKKFDHFRNKNL